MHGLEENCHVEHPWQVRVIELVCLANQFVGHKFKILTAKRMAIARREIVKRHPQGAAHPRLHVVHHAGRTIRWQPFAHRTSIQKGPVHLLG